MTSSRMLRFAAPPRYAAALLAALLLAACAPQPVVPAPEPAPPAKSVPPPDRIAPAPQPAEPPSSRTEPKPDPARRAERVERGRISHYGEKFAGRPTASGQPFDPEALTMAHRSLPFGTRVRVTNLENKRSVELVVNDRGPFVDGRIADVSSAAARVLGMITDGVVEAALEILAPAGPR